jgi:hypothetical protein
VNLPDLRTQGEQIQAAFRDAVRKACERHRRLGVPIAFMQDGKIVIVEPEAGTSVDTARGKPTRSARGGTGRRARGCR